MTLALLFCSTITVAQDDLYTGVVPVSGQDEAERREALPDALNHVLRKLSGERRLRSSAALNASLARAPSALIAFGYREQDRTLPDGSETSQLQLVAQFDPAAADAMVRDLGLRRWRVQRESVVLWPVVDDRTSRDLLPSTYQIELDRMLEVANYRGLPVEWPELSEAEMAEVNISGLWSGNQDLLPDFGVEGQSAAIIAAQRENSLWNVRWTYGDRAGTSSWRSSDPELQVALEQGMNELADRVAAANAIDPAGQGVFSTELLLTDLRNGDDYARGITYLEALSIVDEVRVLGVSPEGLRLALNMNAEPSYLENVFQKDGVIETDPATGYLRLVTRP